MVINRFGNVNGITWDIYASTDEIVDNLFNSEYYIGTRHTEMMLEAIEEELQDHITTIPEVDYIPQEIFNELEDVRDEIFEMLKIKEQEA